MQRILQITTYDIEVPDHGGKLRSHHIRKALRTAYDVHTLSIEWGEAESIDELRVKLDQNRMADMKLNGWLADLGLMDYFDSYRGLYEKMSGAVARFAPDILLIEQPYPLPVVERLIETGAVRRDVKIIYSSHNVEVNLKRKIYADLFEEDKAAVLVTEVEALERGAIGSADVMLCTTQIDDAFAAVLAPDTPRRVFPNGHTRANAPAAAIAKWRALYAGSGRNFAFVGSAHMPNLNGFETLLNAMPESAAEGDLAIWALGTVGPAMQDMKSQLLVRHPYLNITGLMSDEDIDAALQLADAILLPIWEGSGSNLKTAQALLTDRTVIASNFALRGFEPFMDVPGLIIAEGGEDMAAQLMSCPVGQSFARSEAVAQLGWEHILTDLAYFINSHLGQTATGLRA